MGDISLDFDNERDLDLSFLLRERERDLDFDLDLERSRLQKFNIKIIIFHWKKIKYIVFSLIVQEIIQINFIMDKAIC